MTRPLPATGHRRRRPRASRRLRALLVAAAAGLAASAAAAGPPGLPAPGACAEPEPLVLAPPPEDGRSAAERARRPVADARAAAGSLVHRFQPTPVAADALPAGLPPPAAPPVPRPGPCDVPGSGCLGPVQPAPAASPPPAPRRPPPVDFGTGPADPPPPEPPRETPR